MKKRMRCEKTGKFLPSSDIRGTTPLFLRLTEAGATAIKDLSEQLETTKAHVVEQAVIEYLKNLPEPGPKPIMGKQARTIKFRI
jgi:hypothetical protein